MVKKQTKQKNSSSDWQNFDIQQYSINKLEIKLKFTVVTRISLSDVLLI